MRTTVTLDPDVVAALRQRAAERGQSFKEALNSALRTGLRPPAAPADPFAVRSRPMGLRSGIDLDKALRLASELEDSEIARELELRK